MTSIRLDTYLAHANVASRRGASELIANKSVKVNDKLVTKVVKLLGDEKVSYFDGKIWKEAKNQNDQTQIFALNKPIGYITSMKKEGKDPIVASLLPKGLRLTPIGRLDKDSSGLLLFSNSGQMHQALLHPSKHLPKTYHVLCRIKSQLPSPEIMDVINKIARGGLLLDGKATAPCKIKILSLRKDQINLEVILSEGKHRQIRRIFGRFNFDVVGLKRTAINHLDLSLLDISPGKGKILSEAETSMLQIEV